MYVIALLAPLWALGAFLKAGALSSGVMELMKSLLSGLWQVAGREQRQKLLSLSQQEDKEE